MELALLAALVVVVGLGMMALNLKSMRDNKVLAESISALEWELELRDTDKPRTPKPKAPKPGRLIR